MTERRRLDPLDCVVCAKLLVLDGDTGVCVETPMGLYVFLADARVLLAGTVIGERVSILVKPDGTMLVRAALEV